jgi:hypothetical protein
LLLLLRLLVASCRSLFSVCRSDSYDERSGDRHDRGNDNRRIGPPKGGRCVKQRPALAATPAGAENHISLSIRLHRMPLFRVAWTTFLIAPFVD